MTEVSNVDPIWACDTNTSGPGRFAAMNSGGRHTLPASSVERKGPLGRVEQETSIGSPTSTGQGGGSRGRRLEHWA